MTDYEKGFLDGLYDALRNLFPETPVIVSVGSINVLGGEND